MPEGDDQWFKDHLDEIAEIGFYVYNGEYGILLGIDAGGFDFYPEYWAPLYRLYRSFLKHHGEALRPKPFDFIACFNTHGDEEEEYLVAVRRVLAVSGDVITVSSKFHGEQDVLGNRVQTRSRLELQDEGFRVVAEDDPVIAEAFKEGYHDGIHV